MYNYDNALYLLGREKKGASSESVYIYQISLENFKQKKAAYLFDSASSISVVCIIHRGYVYFSYDGGEMEEKEVKLGTKTKLLLGAQHVLAMFGATVLVPFLTGLNPSIALIAAGVGTLVFHFCTKGIVPVI